MEISIKIRKRVLAKINTDFAQNGKSEQEKDFYPVRLYVNDRGLRYYLTTQFATSKIKSNGFLEDVVLVSSHQKKDGKELTKLVESCQDFADKHSQYSADQLKDGLMKLCNEDRSLAKVADNATSLADYMVEFGRIPEHSIETSKMYAFSAKKVRLFDASATLESVDRRWLLDIERWFKDNGLDTNSYSIHLRNIKATMNWACDILGRTDNHPFKGFHIKYARKKQVVLKAQLLADFRDFPCEEWQERYRDYFMLMFYLCGIDIGDLCLLKKESYKGGRIHFYRKKNASRENMVEVDLPVCPEAKRLIEKYRSKEGRYLLDAMDGRVDYTSFMKRMNICIKKIGLVQLVEDKLGKMRKVKYYPILQGITTKTMRRTFVTIASRCGVSEQLIGMALGHSWASSNTTQIYQYFDTDDMDEAILRVIGLVSSLKGRSKEVILGEIKTREGIG